MTFRTIATERLVDADKLSAIVTDGDGSKYLADDGTYKPATGGGTVTSVN